MKLLIAQTELLKLLETTSRAVSTRPAYSVLSCLLLEGDSTTGQLTVTAFDLTLGIRAESSCTVERSGKAALPAQLLTEVVSHLPKAEITLEIKEGAAVLTYGIGKCQIQTVAPQDFPSLPEGGEASVTLLAEDLRSALKATLFAASKSEAMQILTGVHYKFANSSWEAAATDGHRLAVASGTFTKNETTTESEITVPNKSLLELEKLLGEVTSGCSCTVSFDRSIAIFDLPKVRVTTRLLEGQYPSYPSLIPQQFTYKFIADRKAFDAALKRVSIVASGKDKIVKVEFNLKSRCATLSTQSKDTGSAVESVAIEIESEAQENLIVGFNAKYIANALKFVTTDKVLLKASQPIHPVVVTPINSSFEHLILVMPVQLPESLMEEDTSLVEDNLPTGGVSTSETASETAVETPLTEPTQEEPTAKPEQIASKAKSSKKTPYAA